ncbi:hypothetical protein PCASD_24246 [Puccinia coronata f. sp. avenae]|uniref:Uncharacterized protein n=1 Tax=Puccinia coronata f. sp. avenae TaxID=200324 RepID=A0A2N5THP6_9BASI|nr:hypothetical protein PCASD_24246 [Puccinia coronata f. sp. avenae]
MAQQQERSMRVLEGKIASLTGEVKQLKSSVPHSPAPLHLQHHHLHRPNRRQLLPQLHLHPPPKSQPPPQPVHPRTSADEFVEVQTKKIGRSPMRTQPLLLLHHPHRTNQDSPQPAGPSKTYAREKRELVLPPQPADATKDITALLPRVTWGDRHHHSPPLRGCLNQGNIEALLPTISTATNTLREKAVCQADDKVQFLVNMVPTATSTDEDNLQYMKRQLAPTATAKCQRVYDSSSHSKTVPPQIPRRIHLHYCRMG